MGLGTYRHKDQLRFAYNVAILVGDVP